MFLKNYWNWIIGIVFIALLTFMIIVLPQISLLVNQNYAGSSGPQYIIWLIAIFSGFITLLNAMMFNKNELTFVFSKNVKRYQYILSKCISMFTLDLIFIIVYTTFFLILNKAYNNATQGILTYFNNGFKSWYSLIVSLLISLCSILSIVFITPITKNIFMSIFQMILPIIVLLPYLMITSSSKTISWTKTYEQISLIIPTILYSVGIILFGMCGFIIIKKIRIKV